MSGWKDVGGSGDQGELSVLGSDGTLERLPGGRGILTVTSDGRGLGLAQDATAGLLAITPPIDVPKPVDPPTIKVSADPSSSITVAVTKSVSKQQLLIYAGPQKADGTWSGLPQLFVDSADDALSPTFVLRHVFTTWPAAAGSVVPETIRVEVKAVEAGDDTHDGIVNAPQVFHADPRTDSIAPGMPSLTISNGDNSSYVTIGRPSDPDFDRVIVCKTIGTVGASDPRTCDVVLAPTSADTFPHAVNQYVDPRVATTFTAFTVDDSGNVSTRAVVTRPAPTLVPGPAVSDVYLRSGPGVERVYWSGNWAATVRYAAGSTPPATLTDGTLGGQIEDGGAYPDKLGYFAEVPLAAGGTVAVSIFNYADGNLRTYRRTSLVIGAGAARDALTLVGTPRLTAGSIPVLQARLVRGAPLDGPAPLPQETVQLWSRPVGGTAWTATASAVTAVDGTATFRVPAPGASMQYQARAGGTSPAVSSAVASTTVVQTLSISVPKRVARKHVASIGGTLKPNHVATVFLQRYVHKRWITVAKTRTVRGAYRFKYRPKTAGAYVLRAMVANERALVGTQSTVRTMKVK